MSEHLLLTTAGDWNTEDESCDALDACLDEIQLFDVHREVRGSYIQPKLNRSKEDAAPRIDRVLIPKPQLIEMGWTHGPVGIEVKASHLKLGQPLAQLFDYARAVWFVDNTPIMLPWLFIWPAKKLSGTLASILAQHRLGTAEPAYGGIKLATGESVLACLGGIYGNRIGAGVNGRKVGSR